MTTKHALTFVLMDAPFESARTTTAFRLLQAALDQDWDVNPLTKEPWRCPSRARSGTPTPCTVAMRPRKIIR